MSQGRAIDGDEPLFEFDAVDGFESTGLGPGLQQQQQHSPSFSPLGAPIMPSTFFDLSYIPPFSPLDFSSFSPTSTPAEVVDYITRGQEPDSYYNSLNSSSYLHNHHNDVSNLKGKAKAVSQPVDIQPRDSPTPRFDLFSFTGVSPGPSRDRIASPASSSSVPSPSHPYDLSAFSIDSNTDTNNNNNINIISNRMNVPLAASYLTDLTTPGSMIGFEELHDEDLQRSGKGKSRATEPPVLPPLSFSPASLTHGETNWPLDSPSPESSRSYNFSPTSNGETSAVALSPTTEHSLSLHNTASRPRSCSSVNAYTQSHQSTQRKSRSKHSLARKSHPSILSRSLLLKGCESGALFNDEHDPTNTPTFAFVREPYTSFSEPSTPYVFRTSFSDFYKASVTDAGAEKENEKEVDSCHFERLPRELKLGIFHALLAVHEIEGKRIKESPSWSSHRASKKRFRWLGKERGYVELVLASRVCKSWRELVFDGQLWADFNLASYPLFPEELMLRIAVSSGSFVRSLNFHGLARLTAASFLEIIKSLHITPCGENECEEGEEEKEDGVPNNNLSNTNIYHFNYNMKKKSFNDNNNSIIRTSTVTQLTSINLAGCTGLTTQALRELLMSSPSLTEINLRGLPIVTNDTCKTIARYCPLVSSLDLSRCYYIDAEGIKLLLTPAMGAQKKKQYGYGYGYGGNTIGSATGSNMSPLRELRVQGLRKVGDRLLGMLGRYAPLLEVLDLSGARELQNSALEAFVSCTSTFFGEGTDETPNPSETILLSSREAGLDPGDPTKYKRRVTKLRHLALSGCNLLSDVGVGHLAFAVPRLEILELAGIGPELRDEGLVRLLRTTPYLRCLDLDEACEITDETVEAIIPSRRETDEERELGLGLGPVFNSASATSASNNTSAATTTRDNSSPPEPGSHLETLNLSYASRINDDTLHTLVRSCPKLKHIELDNTRVSGTTVKAFVRLMRKRQEEGASIVVVDCRGVGENAVRDLVGSTRTRMGWRGHEAKELEYLDARDYVDHKDDAIDSTRDEDNDKDDSDSEDEEEEYNRALGPLGVGTDECDEKRVTLKSYYSWQVVNAVEAARETRRKDIAKNRKNNYNRNRKGRNRKGGGEEEYSYYTSLGTRRLVSSRCWWPSSSAGGGSGSRDVSAPSNAANSLAHTRDTGRSRREGCIIM